MMMLTPVFFTILNLSGIGMVTALVLLPVKWLLQKLGMPRRVLFLLWAIVAVRFLCPVVPETQVSLFPSSAESVFQEIPRELVRLSVTEEQPLQEPSMMQASWGDVLALVWLCGVAGMMGYGSISLWRLKRRLRFAVRKEGRIYLTDNMATSFVLGVLRPQIYIPEHAEFAELMILHEQTHLRRGDHLTKLLGYLVLTLHWMNPGVWMLFVLFSEDMELACDEQVLIKLGMPRKKEYLNALLQAATKKKSFYLFYGVCFSVSSAKKRIYNLLHYRKRNQLFAVCGSVACVVLAVLLGTNPVQESFAFEAMPVQEEEFPEETTEALPKPPPTATPTITATPIKETAPISEAEEPEEVPLPEEVGFAMEEREEAPLTGTTVPYHYESNCKAEVSGVTCNEKGEISLAFSVNAESLADVIFTDSQTNEKVGTFGIMASNTKVYTFYGFATDKTYQVTVQGRCQGQWKIEGTCYID